MRYMTGRWSKHRWVWLMTQCAWLLEYDSSLKYQATESAPSVHCGGPVYAVRVLRALVRETQPLRHTPPGVTERTGDILPCVFTQMRLT